MSPVQKADAAITAQFYGLLVGSEESGNTITLIGEEKYQGKKAYHLHIVTDDSIEVEVYLDTKTLLEIGRSSETIVEGEIARIETVSDDYKKKDGVQFARSIRVEMDGQDVGHIRIDKISINAVLPDSMFAIRAE